MEKIFFSHHEFAGFFFFSFFWRQDKTKIKTVNKQVLKKKKKRKASYFYSINSKLENNQLFNLFVNMERCFIFN